MKFLRTSWWPILLGIIVIIVVLSSLLSPRRVKVESFHEAYRENEEWIAPTDDEIPADEEGDLIRYGKELIVHTSKYLGPKGIAGVYSNGMNCQNCHLDAGARSWANPFSAVANTYPRFRERSGRLESVEFRVNDCMQRSLDGKPLDSLSLEMRAMVAYLKWMGKDVPKGIKPKGTGTQMPAFLPRAADPVKGKEVYIRICQRCHGENGEGFIMADSTAYTYPPLWGPNSYNTGAGMYQLSRLASFVRNNMPFDKTTSGPVLTDEECWDVAAFVNSQPRPTKSFPMDWPNIAKKPMDFPFGPYADSLSEQRHKYGPFVKK